MSTDTATIRVSRETRDRLAAQAEAQGISLSALLTQLAGPTDREREEAFRSEREASLADAANPKVAEEERLWDTVLGDGIP